MIIWHIVQHCNATGQLVKSMMCGNEWHVHFSFDAALTRLQTELFGLHRRVARKSNNVCIALNLQLSRIISLHQTMLGQSTVLL